MTKIAVRHLLLGLLLVSLVACSVTGTGKTRENALRAELEALPVSAENIDLVADLGAEEMLSVHAATLTSRHLIVEDPGGRLFALDRANLMPAWHYYGLPRTLDFAMCEASLSYIMVTKNTLFHVAKVTGAELGVFPLPFTPSSAPAGNDSTAYVGSWASPVGNKTVYSVNLADGLLGWGYRTTGHVRAQPVVGGAPRQLLYVATDEPRGKVYALEARGAFESPPDPSWMAGMLGRNSADLVASGPLLLVASEEGSLYALDRATGTKTWEFASGQPLKTAPMATANGVYFHNAYGFHALDRSGKPRWKIEEGPTALLLERGDEVWLKNDEGMVWVVDAASGEVESSVELEGWHLPTNTADGTFYAVSPDGWVFAYTERLKLQ
jgi:outer membrane protein assembly factor BamB